VFDVLQNLAHGFSVALTPTNLMFAFAGVMAGMIIGALPGIGTVVGVSLLLPLTYGMDPTTAIIMLAGIYYGAQYGGTITSVLINMPGESATVATTLDGYQMARQGRAAKALGIATIGSFIAGTFGVIVVTLLSPILANFALRFGPPEYFALVLLGFTALGAVSGNSLAKGLTSVVLGLLISTVGLDIMSGRPRFTFGYDWLLGGLGFIVVAIGIFGIGEILDGMMLPGGHPIIKTSLSWRNSIPSAAEWARSRMAIVRGTLIGLIIGILPGAGSTLASFVAYAVERNASKHPEEFGKGAIEGVAAPESANNSASAGAMIPLLTLGVPGSGTTAVLLGGFLLWGLRPGPLLFTQNPEFAWGLIASMYIGNVMLVLLNIFAIPVFASMLWIPYGIQAAFVVLFAVLGAYSLNNNPFDVIIMVAFGLLGFAMKRLDYSAAGLILGLVLGPLAEKSLRQSLTLSHGDWSIFFTRPVSGALMVLALLALLWPLARKALTRNSGDSGGLPGNTAALQFAGGEE
jgi:putative tricarboxylic transport membrane protein